MVMKEFQKYGLHIFCWSGNCETSFHNEHEVLKHWSYEEPGYEVQRQIPSSSVQMREQSTLNFQSAEISYIKLPLEVYYLSFEVLTLVTMKIILLWDLTPCCVATVTIVSKEFAACTFRVVEGDIFSYL
jgi:hypothetical protein